MSRFPVLARRSALLGASFAAVLVASGCARRAVDTPPVSVVFFEAQSAGLDGPARGVIREFAADARQVPTRPVIVRGYADRVGSAAANVKLSGLRAQVVADALTAEGIAASRITQRPRGSTDTDPGIESRRVEIELVR